MTGVTLYVSNNHGRVERVVVSTPVVALSDKGSEEGEGRLKRHRRLHSPHLLNKGEGREGKVTRHRRLHNPYLLDKVLLCTNTQSSYIALYDSNENSNTFTL